MGFNLPILKEKKIIVESLDKMEKISILNTAFRR